MSQPKTHSLLESLTNVAFGYFVALASQLLIFPLYGIHIPLSDNAVIGVWFTVISIIRSYVLRRMFNRVSYIREKVGHGR
jgi:hypothetical protein